ncbi:S-layer homology domain-containing protein [Paenibacillus validus]|uniref:S-layer homology domain-containing protein n=1 Tax=Paenibacillus validus TaxID=44253 RepID=UPI003D2E0AAC
MKSNRWINKISMVLLSWCLLISMLGGLAPAYADGAGRGLVTVPQAIDDAAGYILDANGGALSDWDAYALAAAGKQVPASYLSSVREQLQQNGGRYSKVTDYARIALGVKSAGGNPEQIAAGSSSYNLIEGIYNSDVLTAQGTNGAIYALLALSGDAYHIPLTAKWNPDKIVAWLLAQQNADGGWPLGAGGPSSIDITASAVNALAAHTAHTGVRPAMDRGIQWLSSQQLANGGFSEYGENAESTAQVILALSAAGLDARSSGFAKANGNPLTYLFGYRQGDGGFAHVAGGSSDGWATVQSLVALAAFHTAVNGDSGSYEAILTTGGGAPAAARVTVHVEGPAGTIAEGSAVAGTAYEAVAQVLHAQGVPFQESDGHFIHTINGISGKSDYSTWWWYNVKRQGSWDYARTNNLGMADYSLRNGDDIYLYYTGISTALVDSIKVEPAMPVEGQAVTVQVYRSVWDYDVTRDEVVTVAASVYVELGGRKVETDANGYALFPSGLPGGTYQAVVTGYQDGLAPKIVKDSKTIQVGTAAIQIEGASGTYAEGKASSPNLLESVVRLLDANQVPYELEHASFGTYIQSVGADAGAWLYAIYRQGKWNPGMVGADQYTLQPGDRAVVYISGFDAEWNSSTYLVDSIALNPAQPKANESFTVTVKKTLADNKPASPAAGIQVKIGSLTATTSSEGIATFAGLPAGTYTLDISGYVTGEAPKVVHTSQPVTIQPRTGGGTDGGTGPVVNPVVYVSVTGDSSMGTILPSTSVSLQSGDTPYSILIRALGAGRVQSSGSGSTAYVQGIDGLREFDRGPLSGWMYAVNGTYLSTGADSTSLKPGDTVAWRYTLDGGKDLNAGAGTGGTGAVGVPVAPTVPAAADVVQKLEMPYNNRKPIHEIAKPAIVLNADKKMTANAADTLKKDLAANTVNVQKAAAADTETVIADAKAEVQLQVPAGALKETTKLTVSELPSASAGRNELVSSMYEFGPQGQSFDTPVQISIKTPVASVSLDQLALVWLDEQTEQWIPIPAVIDAETGTVTGWVNHFTKFAVIDKSKVASAAGIDVGPSIERAAQWLKGGVELSDWSAYALSRAGVAVPNDYLALASAKLKEKNGEFRNVTDYERLALSIQAAGGNPESIGGFNLIERIYNNERMEVQGSNGPIYALLALNGGAYRIPADAKWTTGKLAQWILDVQNADGSWPLVKGEQGNPDLTAAALAALTPYQERTDVKAAMERAVKWLGSVQSPDGGFALNGVENAESTAQVIWGLSVSGTDPVNSPYFKSGKQSMLACLLGLQLSNGGFPHERGGEAEVMATEQALMALGAYQAYVNLDRQVPAAPVYADQTDIASWALPFVQKASIYRIMEGTGGSVPVFEPKQKVTRVQFTAMLLRMMGEAPLAEATTDFADVAPDAWYAGYVTKAVAKGIVQGVSADRFAPDAAISRQEMAIMLARALQLQATGADSAGFIDMSESYPDAVPFIQAVREQGLMEGDEAGRFLPLDSATREMAAVVAVRAYELTKKP